MMEEILERLHLGLLMQMELIMIQQGHCYL